MSTSLFERLPQFWNKFSSSIEKEGMAAFVATYTELLSSKLNDIQFLSSMVDINNLTQTREKDIYYAQIIWLDPVLNGGAINASDVDYFNNNYNVFSSTTQRLSFAKLVSCKTISENIYKPRVNFVLGVDFIIPSEGNIDFFDNIFNVDSNLPIEILSDVNPDTGNRIYFKSSQLFFKKAVIKEDWYYKRMGFLLGLPEDTNPGIVTSLYRLRTEGMTRDGFDAFAQACNGLPVALKDEEVISIEGNVITTNLSVYTVNSSLPLKVNVGTSLKPGSALVEAVQAIDYSTEEDWWNNYDTRLNFIPSELYNFNNANSEEEINLKPETMFWVGFPTVRMLSFDILGTFSKCILNKTPRASWYWPLDYKLTIPLNLASQSNESIYIGRNYKVHEQTQVVPVTNFIPAGALPALGNELDTIAVGSDFYCYLSGGWELVSTFTFKNVLNLVDDFPYKDTVSNYDIHYALNNLWDISPDLGSAPFTYKENRTNTNQFLEAGKYYYWLDGSWVEFKYTTLSVNQDDTLDALLDGDLITGSGTVYHTGITTDTVYNPASGSELKNSTHTLMDQHYKYHILYLEGIGEYIDYNKIRWDLLQAVFPLWTYMFYKTECAHLETMDTDIYTEVTALSRDYSETESTHGFNYETLDDDYSADYYFNDDRFRLDVGQFPDDESRSNYYDCGWPILVNGPAGRFRPGVTPILSSYFFDNFEVKFSWTSANAAFKLTFYSGATNLIEISKLDPNVDSLDFSYKGVGIGGGTFINSSFTFISGLLETSPTVWERYVYFSTEDGSVGPGIIPDIELSITSMELSNDTGSDLNINYLDYGQKSKIN